MDIIIDKYISNTAQYLLNDMDVLLLQSKLNALIKS